VRENNTAVMGHVVEVGDRRTPKKAVAKKNKQGLAPGDATGGGKGNWTRWERRIPCPYPVREPRGKDCLKTRLKEEEGHFCVRIPNSNSTKERHIKS